MLHRTSSLVLVLLAAAFATGGCESGNSLEPGSPASVAIDVSPDSLAGSWVLAGPGGAIARGRGDTLLAGAGPGDYWLLCEPVEGWHSPPVNPDSLRIAVGSHGKFEMEWSRIVGKPGAVVIAPEPADLGVLWNLRGPFGFFAAGSGARVLRGRAPGEYTVTWGSQEGYRTPPPESLILEPGREAGFHGSYTPAIPEGGTIEVDPYPASIDAPWRLELPGGDAVEARGDTVLTDMPVGDYTILWQKADGFLVPEPARAHLDAWSTLEFGTTYVTPLHPVGTIEVEVEPDGIVASWQLASDAGFATGGSGDSTLTGLLESRYAIVWHDVPGHLKPAPIVSVLEEGGVLRLTGRYRPAGEVFGNIRIDPDPDSLDAPWELVSGSGVVVQGSGDSTLIDQAPGTYTLTWGEVEGFEPPVENPVTRTLDPGGTLGFSLQ